MAIVHVTLAVRDVRQTTAFFEEALGWQPIIRPANVDGPAAWLAIAPGQELHLLEVAGFAPSAFESEFGRHIAVAFPQADFPVLRRRLEAAGAALIAAVRPTSFERFFFRDPNGYLFEVVADERPPSS